MKSIKEMYQTIDSTIDRCLDWAYNNQIRIQSYTAKTLMAGGGLTMLYEAMSQNPNPAVVAGGFAAFGLGFAAEFDVSLRLMEHYKKTADNDPLLIP